ncbi:MAG: replication-associated recombination protein A [Deltaproteobacteria bacterium]|nr:replication-associated recombination protein A [Deltaproteobacteria bacterium]
MDLFASTVRSSAPLADRMRPRTLAEVSGQEALLAAGRPLAEAIARDRVPSMILWGPPGSGKTTLAHVIAGASGAHFEPFSAVLGGVKEVRAIVEAATGRKNLDGRRTILFVDEIHRFNRAQQDAFLPHVEAGTIVLVGATTENPSFAVNGALLSRCRTFRLEPLSAAEIAAVLERTLVDAERGLGALGLEVEPGVVDLVAASSDGDARRALSTLELLAQRAVEVAKKATLADARLALEGRLVVRWDRNGEEHFNVVSAFIKSLRGSDPDAAVYWMVRMLEGGEDPLFILRRMLIFASEDVGNADPRSLDVAVAADAAFQRVGLPEGVLVLTQAATYLATAPKSNAALVAYGRARKDVTEHGSLPVPMKLRNAPTRAMREWGYGDGYRYPHDFEGSYVPERYLPDELAGRRYYAPKGAGEERRIAERLREIRDAAAAERDETDDDDGSRRGR